VLDLLQFPHEAEDFQVIVHDFGCEYGRKRCKVIYPVVQLEHLPSPVTLLVVQQFDIKTIKKLRCVELCVARSYRCIKERSECVFVELTCCLLQLFSQQIHEVLHQVTLSHQEVFADVHAVAFELILLEQNLQKLCICFLMCLFDPLFELVDVKTVLVRLERRLQRHIENPVLLLATSPYEIDCFACLQNLVGQAVAQKGGYHDIV
jgi:hypothetical protein